MNALRCEPLPLFSQIFIAHLSGKITIPACNPPSIGSSLLLSTNWEKKGMEWERSANIEMFINDREFLDSVQQKALGLAKYDGVKGIINQIKNS